MNSEYLIVSEPRRALEIAGAAVFFFVLVVLVVRLSGKRTTGELNNFDWIITVAVGSLAASGILLEDVAVADAAIAIIVLALCQFSATKLVLESKAASRLFKAEPTLLAHKGTFLTEAMKRTRISQKELLAALRREGMTDCAQADWIVLETNGRLTVIPRGDIGLTDARTMADVRKPPSLSV